MRHLERHRKPSAHATGGHRVSSIARRLQSPIDRARRVFITRTDGHSHFHTGADGHTHSTYSYPDTDTRTDGNPITDAHFNGPSLQRPHSRHPLRLVVRSRMQSRRGMAGIQRAWHTLTRLPHRRPGQRLLLRRRPRLRRHPLLHRGRHPLQLRRRSPATSWNWVWAGMASRSPKGQWP